MDTISIGRLSLRPAGTLGQLIDVSIGSEGVVVSADELYWIVKGLYETQKESRAKSNIESFLRLLGKE